LDGIGKNEQNSGFIPNSENPFEPAAGDKAYLLYENKYKINSE
jgi:hypothetical protein